MNAAPSGGRGPVRNQDKRTSRLDNKDSFQRAILQHRAGLPAAIGIPAQVGETASRGINVCVRKRPLFPHEVDAGDYDATTVHGGSRIVVHDGRMKPDMVHMEMKHYQYMFGRVFDEETGNDSVYESTAAPLVRHAAQGGTATVFMFGQTGSGKTYTMTAIHERAVAELFSTLDGDEASVSMSYVELAGSSCRDMLNDGAAVDIMADKRGDVQLCGVEEKPASHAEELLSMMTEANQARATCATGVHDQSSRTHAVCRVTIRRAGAADGVFTMVDLAGSERSKDSMYHDQQLQKETAEINSSLMALKDCVRELSRGSSHIPFRSSSLTQLLRSCFTDETACTVVIVTVAPSSGDTDHTLGTLQHACLMDGQSKKDGDGVTTVAVESAATLIAEEAKRSAPKEPKKWTKEDVEEWWMDAAATALKIAKQPLKKGDKPPFPAGTIDGKVLLRWPQKRFAQELGNPKAGETLYKMLRKRVKEYSELKKGVAAVRRGEVNLPATSSSSSTSSARCSPQRGTPTSIKRNAAGKVVRKGGRPSASPARMSNRRPSASPRRSQPSASPAKGRSSVQSPAPGELPALALPSALGAAIEARAPSAPERSPMSPLTGPKANRRNSTATPQSTAKKSPRVTPKVRCSHLGFEVAGKRLTASGVYLQGLSSTNSRATPRQRATPRRSGTLARSSAQRVPKVYSTPLCCNPPAKLNDAVLPQATPPSKGTPGGVDSSPYGLAQALGGSAKASARTNARMKAQAADAMEYLKQLEANEQYQQEDATASS